MMTLFFLASFNFYGESACGIFVEKNGLDIIEDGYHRGILDDRHCQDKTEHSDKGRGEADSATIKQVQATRLRSS